ncbi:dynein regulatory complex subunit 2 [Myripristis murdjan]|uniref:dynein regulatory complex subunit 2 n=1 Tax=Myripristis murdjan TaxID=586833 RepID=UPI0011761691|nr:dynein regulatory complex subunit 2 [Myripristis murdjan]XP_029927457.1 dynein regulatory complex subunit 2 [Myripristis murdjan]
MPKKAAKKGGGGKVSRLTEEERLLLLQQRAQAEEEQARRKEEMLNKFLKDKLQKEERNTVVNLLKVNQGWRSILRQTKSVELQRDVAELRQSFERTLDCKDSIIKCLVKDLSEADEQAMRARRSHLQCLERLQALHQHRLAELQQQWSSSLQQLSKDFNSDREQQVALQQQQCEYLQDVCCAMQQQHSALETEAQEEYQSSCDGIKNRSNEEKPALQARWQDEAEALWRQAEEILSKYDKKAEERHTTFKEMSARDQDLVCDMRAKLGFGQREAEVLAGGLAARRDEIAQGTRQLQTQITQNHLAARRRLAELCTRSTAATKRLQSIIAKGEKILRLAEMCRKLESQHEKVLPFFTSSLTAEEQSQVGQRALELPSEELAKDMQNYADLERFWQRHNKVVLDVQNLKQDKKLLMAERQQLQALLQQHVNSFSVSKETPDHTSQTSRLLLVSKPSIATTMAAGRQGKRHTVIEAAHVKQYAL